MERFSSDKKIVQSVMNHLTTFPGDSQIKKTLLITHFRESGFSQILDCVFSKDHISIDNEFVALEDVVLDTGVSIDQIERVGVNAICHPRNKIICISEQEVFQVRKLKEDLHSEKPYITEKESVKLLGVSYDLLWKYAEMLKFQSRSIFGIKCFLLSDILAYQEVISRKISVQELSGRFNWSQSTVTDHLIRSNIICEYPTDKTNDGIYERDETIKEFESLKAMDFRRRSSANKLLGYEVFIRCQLMAYQDRNGNVLYRFDDMRKMQDLFKSVDCNLIELGRIRHQERYKPNLDFPVSNLFSSVKLELMNYGRGKLNEMETTKKDSTNQREELSE
jgi:hypothetical protein